MGMFDWVRCTRVLPDGVQVSCNDVETLFQTKSLECSLDLIIIGDDGTVRVKRQQYHLNNGGTIPEDDYSDAELLDYKGTIDFGKYTAVVRHGQLINLVLSKNYYAYDCETASDETDEIDRLEAERAAEWARLTPEEQDKRMATASAAMDEHFRTELNRGGAVRMLFEAHKKLVL